MASVFGLAGSSQLGMQSHQTFKVALSYSDLRSPAAEYSASKHALLGLHDSLRNELIYRSVTHQSFAQ